MFLTHLTVFWIVWGVFTAGYERKREKRIIKGILLPNFRGARVYDAIRYTVWIGDGRLAPTLRRHWYSVYADTVVADPPHLWCSGVLLTPEIVQTTCSCISYFLWQYSNDFYRIKATVFSAWEYRLEVFFGHTEVHKMTVFFYAKNYIVYNQCAKIYLPTIDDPGGDFISYVSYDFGLIVMDKNIAADAPDAQISYTPAMPFEDIINFYHSALKNEITCLVFGYGHVNESWLDYEIPNYGANAEFLHYLWRPLLNYFDCYYALFRDPVDQRYVSPSPYEFDYARDATWACANSPNPKWIPERGSSSAKDRGGPVSCNGVYFGLVSDSFWYRTAHFRDLNERPHLKISLYSAIVFTLWENSANYREEFLDDIKYKLEGQGTYPDPFDDVIHWRPTYKLFASSSAKIHVSHLVVMIGSHFAQLQFL